MMRVLRFWLAIAAAVYGLNAFAQDVTVSTPGRIPFKTEATPLETNGSRVGWSILGLLGAAGVAALVVRKKKLPLARRKASEDHIKVLDRTRLNQRTMLYVVQFGQKKLLIGQTGDQLAHLAEAEVAASQSDAETRPAG